MDTRERQCISRDTMYLPETQCIFQNHNVSSGDTMCLLETQCLYQRHNVSSRDTMCLPEIQCIFQTHNVSTGDTMCVPETKCVWSRDTMSLPETACPGQKLTSRLSPDMFPASIRIKMMRETRWQRQKCPEYLKNHENSPPIFFSKKFKILGKQFVDVKLKIKLFCGFKP